MQTKQIASERMKNVFILLKKVPVRMIYAVYGWDFGAAGEEFCQLVTSRAKEQSVL